MSKNIDFYLSKGFDRATAEYFINGRKKITSVKPQEDFTLVLRFDSGECRLYDVKPLLEIGTIFEPFFDYENFKRVYLDEQGSVCWDIDPTVDSNIVWSNKVDLCCDSCYIDSIPIGGV